MWPHILVFRTNLPKLFRELSLGGFFERVCPNFNPPIPPALTQPLPPQHKTRVPPRTSYVITQVPYSPPGVSVGWTDVFYSGSFYLVFPLKKTSVPLARPMYVAFSPLLAQPPYNVRNVQYTSGLIPPLTLRCDILTLGAGIVRLGAQWVLKHLSISSPPHPFRSACSARMKGSPSPRHSLRLTRSAFRPSPPE